MVEQQTNGPVDVVQLLQSNLVGQYLSPYILALLQCVH